jgi:sugar lactone lactonase YvrE
MTWTTVVAEPSELGESPFWHPAEQRLYWIDIDGRQIRRCCVADGRVESWAMPEEPGCIAPALSAEGVGGLIIALRSGLYRATTWGGALRLLATAPYDTATTRFNDGKADPLGRFWAGTVYDPRTEARAELFSLDGRSGPPGSLTRHAGGATVANGLAWSPDSQTVYWGDTTSHTIRAWNWDGAANRLSNERVFKQWPLKPAGWRADDPAAPAYGGRPDGAAVDSEGNYHVAMFEGARLLKLSPDGEVLADIAVPARCPTMPCFGGPDLKTLYLTTARHGRPASELARFAQSGCVLSMRVETPGLPAQTFIG